MQTFEIEDRVSPLATACDARSQVIAEEVQDLEMNLKDNISMDSNIPQPEEIAKDIQQIETKDRDDTPLSFLRQCSPSSQSFPQTFDA
jgi:hypothetical protein